MKANYIETMKLRSCHSDCYGVWRPDSILEFMQETAGAHSASFGLDRATMDSMGIAWVLSRLKVRFERMPKTGETITIETFPTKNRLLFFPRSHIFFDAAGKEIGHANSLWVLLDLEKRKITQNSIVTASVPNNEGFDPVLPTPSTVRTAGGESVKGEIVPKFSELDMNLHVNNTKYLAWCQDALGSRVLKDKWISEFDVNYESEIRECMHIETETNLDGDHFSFIGMSGGRKHFSIGGILTDREQE